MSQKALRDLLERAFEAGHWAWPTPDHPTRAAMRAYAVDGLMLEAAALLLSVAAPPAEARKCVVPEWRDQGIKVVLLQTGGHIKISGAFNWLCFRESERALIVSIFDAIEKYEGTHVGLQAHDGQALQGGGTGPVPPGAPTDKDHNACHDGAGQGALEAKVEVQNVSSGVPSEVRREQPQSADAVDPVDGITTS